MGIVYNKDGSMTITLDENNNLPQSLLGNPILSKEIDDLMSAKDSSKNYFRIEDMSDTSFNPVDLSGIDLSKFEKDALAEDIDKSLGLNQDIDTDVTKFPLINKYLQGMLYGIDGEGGALGLKDSYDELIQKTKEEILADKNKKMSAPGKGDTRVAPVEIFERITGLDKNKKTKKEKEKEPLSVNIKVPMKDGSGEGMGLSEFIASKMKPADGDSDETPKDERTKIQKLMDGLLSKDDFLMDLGLRLIEGEGLFPGAIKAAKTQKAADTAEAKAALDAKLADSLIKERLSPADILQVAQVEAANVNPDPTSAEYKEALNKSIIRQTSKSKDELSPTDLILLTMLSGGNTQEAAQGYLNSYNNQNVAGDAVENFKAYDVNAASKS